MGHSVVVVVAEGVVDVVVDAVAVGEAEQGEEQQNDRASREGTDRRDKQHRQSAVGRAGSLPGLLWGSFIFSSSFVVIRTTSTEIIHTLGKSATES